MTTLNVTILGLDRLGASFGLALKRYAKENGKYQFAIAGYDFKSAQEKAAHKAGAVDRVEKSPESAAKEAQIILMNLPYDEVRRVYRQLAGRLREGVVILDASPVKRPSFDWAREFLSGDVHVVGFTPLPAARFLETAGLSADDASADYFDQAPCLVVPSADSLPEAVDLAYNVAYLLGAKPRFVDPADYDAMIAMTEQLPRLLGIVMFYHLTQNESWNDLRYLTGPAFGLMTRTLHHEHPDALRDQFDGNRAVLARSIDGLIHRLQEVRDALNSSDRSTLEALLVKASADYEAWLNDRTRIDWDKDHKDLQDSGGVLSLFVGESLAKRLKGKK
jgi:prephenate dehydrogenase